MKNYIFSFVCFLQNKVLQIVSCGCGSGVPRLVGCSITLQNEPRSAVDFRKLICLSVHQYVKELFEVEKRKTKNENLAGAGFVLLNFAKINLDKQPFTN